MGMLASIKSAGNKIVAAANTNVKDLPLINGTFTFGTKGKHDQKANRTLGQTPPTFPAIDSVYPYGWSNIASAIGPSGYLLMRTSDPVATAIGMLGAEVGKLKLFAFAPKAGIDPHSPEALKPENQSDRAKAMQKFYDHMLGTTQFQMQSPWAMAEGVLFWQIRWVMVEGVGLVPDLRWGERRKVDAGGNLWLHPTYEAIVQRRYTSAPGGTVDEETVSTLDWIVLKPGTSDNPQGDGELALRLHRTAVLYQDGDYNGGLFAKTMTLPTRILKWFSDMLNSDDLRTRQTSNEDELDFQQRIEMLQLGDNRTVVDLLQYPTDGVKYLLDRETRLEARAMKAVMNTALLADTRATGPTGSSKEARTTANAPVLNYANIVAEAITCYLNPSIVERNSGIFGEPLPDIQDGEMEVRAQYVLPGALGGDTNPTEKPAADVVPEDKRPDPEGTGKKKEDSDEVK